MSASDYGSLRIRSLVLLTLLVLLLIGGAWLAVKLTQVWRAVTALRVDLAAGKLLAAEGIENPDPEQAIGLLHTTHSDLEDLQSALRPFLRIAPYLGWLPRYGPEIESAPVLLSIALDLTAAGESVAEPLAPLLEKAKQEDDPSSGTFLGEATRTLAAARPRLVRARELVR